MAVTASYDECTGTYTFSGRAKDITRAKNRALEPYGKQVLDYGLQLELLPAEGQAGQINRTIGCARFVRNDTLSVRIRLYAEKKETLSGASYKKDFLPRLKEENPWLREVDKFALESAVEHVDCAYKNFFEGRAGFPRFASVNKPNGNAYTTKYTNNNIRLSYGDDGLPYLRLPKVGDVRVILPKKRALSDIVPQGVSILKVTVRRRGSRYFASLGLQTVIDRIMPAPAFSVSDITGIDVGLKSFCHWGTAEDKETVENPRWIWLHERRVRRLQKALARKQYDQDTHTGSRNYDKARARLAREHEKIRNQRKDFHHKLSRRIADSCLVLACEDLNIRGMMKNRRLSKAVASVGWGQFLAFLKYKVERKGGIFIRADRWYPSSQTCSCCGYRNTDVRDLSIRKWRCPGCGALHDRDDNAVDNLILYAARALGLEPAA